MYHNGYIVSCAQLGSQSLVVERIAAIIERLLVDQVCTLKGASIWSWREDCRGESFPPGDRDLVCFLKESSPSVDMMKRRMMEKVAFGYLVTLQGIGATFGLSDQQYRILNVDIAVVSKPLFAPRSLRKQLQADCKVDSLVNISVCAIGDKRIGAGTLKKTLELFGVNKIEEMIWV